MAGELVHASVEVAALELEVAQLHQALTSRIWIEQAKGCWRPPRAPTPRWRSSSSAPARSSSGKLAEVAEEVVQDAQHPRLAALALDDVRVREAEGRAQAAEQALQAAQADLAQRRVALDQAQVAADERERAADDRDRIADERDRVAHERDRTAGHPD